MSQPDAYRRIAPWYDKVVGRMDGGLKSIARSMVPPEQGLTVLDVGCGTGTALEPYAAAGCICHGIDASAAMLEQAQNLLKPSAELTLGDAAELPYADDTFDLVLASVFIHELGPDTQRQVMSEMARVVAPTGGIQIVDYAAGELSAKGRAIRGVAMIVERLAGKEHKRNLGRYLAAGGVAHLATSCDLVVDAEKVVGGGNMGIYLLRPPQR
ncbi:MAG: class I SAM-dependent methyltransferase [Acidimicrobiia bacterium]